MNVTGHDSKDGYKLSVTILNTGVKEIIKDFETLASLLRKTRDLTISKINNNKPVEKWPLKISFTKTFEGLSTAEVLLHLKALGEDIEHELEKGTPTESIGCLLNMVTKNRRLCV